jgi:hypothetical protein
MGSQLAGLFFKVNFEEVPLFTLPLKASCLRSKVPYQAKAEKLPKGKLKL